MLPNSTNATLSRSRQRLIKVDFSKLQVSCQAVPHATPFDYSICDIYSSGQDDEQIFDDSSISSGNASTAAAAAHLAELHRYSQPKMPPYPIGGYILGGQMRHESPALLMRPRRTSEYRCQAKSIYLYRIYNRCYEMCTKYKGTSSQ